MFGYINVNGKELSEENKNIYQSYYCGLCRALGNRHNSLCRMTLSYDITFLSLFLSAVYDAPESLHSQKCRVHPLKKQEYLKSEILDYAADMNIYLAYYNMLDDWNDDKNFLSLGESRLLEKECKKVEQSFPRQCRVIREKLDELSGIEKANVLIPDVPANCFGDLMGELFVPFEDSLDERLRTFGKALGKYIYILDACMDLKKDLKKQSYNPLVICQKKEFDDILHMLMSDVVSSYQALNFQKDRAIIENILFSGVLIKYELYKKRGVKKK